MPLRLWVWMRVLACVHVCVCACVWGHVWVCFCKTVPRGASSRSIFSLRNAHAPQRNLSLRGSWPPGSRGQSPASTPDSLSRGCFQSLPRPHVRCLPGGPPPVSRALCCRRQCGAVVGAGILPRGGPGSLRPLSISEPMTRLREPRSVKSKKHHTLHRADERTWVDVEHLAPPSPCDGSPFRGEEAGISPQAQP